MGCFGRTTFSDFLISTHCMRMHKISFATDPLPNCYAVTSVVALLSIMASLSECSVEWLEVLLCRLVASNFEVVRPGNG